MAKSKKLLIDLCGVIVFFATAFFIMYAVTGKIPFFSETVPEPRRNRRVSYRREKMDESEISSLTQAPRNRSRGITQAPPNALGEAMFTLVYNGCKECLDLIGDVGSGYMARSRDNREFDPVEIETLYNNAMEVGGVAAQQLRSGCSKCFRTMLAFSQGANREWSGY